MTETVSPTHRHKPESDRSPTHPPVHPIYIISYHSCAIAYLRTSLSVVILFVLPNSTVWLSIVMRAKAVTFSANLEIVSVTDTMSHPLCSCHLPLPSLIDIPHTLNAAARLTRPIQADIINVAIQNECQHCNAAPTFLMPHFFEPTSRSHPDDATYEDKTGMPRAIP